MGKSTIAYNLDGIINKESIKGNGTISFDGSGMFDADIAFGKFPTVFHPYALGQSLLSIACGDNALKMAFTHDLSDLASGKGGGLSQGSYHGYRGYTVLDDKNVVVGSFSQHLVMKKLTPTSSEASIHLFGQYNGPHEDLDRVFGYDLDLKQKGPGKIGGTCTTGFTTKSGSLFSVLISAEYTFPTMAEFLPSVLKVTYERGKFERASDSKASLKVVGTSAYVPSHG